MREMVSVIITTYKGAKKLQRAILSVLGQTYSNVEIIVVDDNNPGTIERADTEKVMATFKKNKNIRYIQHKKIRTARLQEILEFVPRRESILRF